MGALSLLRLSLFRMSLDTSGVLILALELGGPRSRKQGRGQERKEEPETQKNLQNKCGSSKAGLQGLCNSLAVATDTLLHVFPFLQQLGQTSLGLQLQELCGGQGTSDCSLLTPGPQCVN